MKEVIKYEIVRDFFFMFDFLNASYLSCEIYLMEEGKSHKGKYIKFHYYFGKILVSGLKVANKNFFEFVESE